MKGTLAVVLLTLMALVPDAQAQWHLGGLLDVNRAYTSINPPLDGDRTYHGRIAFGIGAVVDYSLTQQIDLHSQVMLLGKGSTLKDPDFSGDVVWKPAYLEIPLLVRYTFQNEASVHPYAIAGPSFGLLRSATFSMAGGDDQEDDDTKRFDMSIVLGVGASRPQGTRTFFGEVRYAHGLVNVVDQAGFDNTLKHRGVQLLVGVTFAMGKQ